MYRYLHQLYRSIPNKIDEWNNACVNQHFEWDVSFKTGKSKIEHGLLYELQPLIPGPVSKTGRKCANAEQRKSDALLEMNL